MTPVSSVSTVSSAATSPQHKQLEQAAQAFEAIFLRNMISAMRKSSIGDDLMSNSGGDQFRDMMDDHIADDMAKGSGLGIAELLIEQWKDRI
jgi:flagellar protein FlgJ